MPAGQSRYRPAAPQPSLRPVVPAYPSCYRLPRLTSRGRPRRSPMFTSSKIEGPRPCPPNFPRQHSVSSRAKHPSVLSALYFHDLTNPFFRNPFIFTSIQNPQGVTLRHCHPSSSPPRRSLRLLAREAGVCVKFRVSNPLRTLFLSCRSFSDSRPLFSIVCALFDKNTRGVGTPGRLCGTPGRRSGFARPEFRAGRFWSLAGGRSS
jgi:hypothetical protein